MRLVSKPILVVVFLTSVLFGGNAPGSSPPSGLYAFSTQDQSASVPLRVAALSERRAQAAARDAGYQVLLTPQCKRDLCIDKLIQSVEPLEIVKNGTIRRYEISSLERKCADENQGDCKRPSPSDFINFTQSFAFCSATNPTIVSTAADAAKSSYYIATFLNFGTEMRTYQVDGLFEYLAVCYGWEPRKFDDRYETIVTAWGYRPADEKPAPQQKHFSSEAQVLSFLRAEDIRGSLPTSPSVQALEGRWYSGDVAVCRGNVGETEGLLAFRGGHFIGLENDCTIRQSKSAGRSLTLRMTCSGEGLQSQEVETIEFLSGDKIKRTVSVGKNRYTSTHMRCP